MNYLCITCGVDRPTANGRECGYCFRQRLLSVRLDTSVTATRTKTSYYDASSVDDVWGQDAHEKMLDDTDGLGALKTIGGRSYRKDRKSHEYVPVTDKELDQVYLGGRNEEHG